jgi:hypothetical protein
MRPIEQRLAKLEQATSMGESFYAWAKNGETAEQAIARKFPDGLAHNAVVTVFSWTDNPMPSVADGLGIG